MTTSETWSRRSKVLATIRDAALPLGFGVLVGAWTQDGQVSAAALAIVATAALANVASLLCTWKADRAWQAETERFFDRHNRAGEQTSGGA